MSTEQNGGDIDVLACGEASALHASTAGGLNLVGIGNLRVIVKHNSERWSAQGLEIDYAVDGGSFEDVTDEFANGLMLTINENLRVFGHIRNVLKVAPPEIWKEFFDGALDKSLIKKLRHSQTSIHHIPLDLYVEEAA